MCSERIGPHFVLAQIGDDNAAPTEGVMQCAVVVASHETRRASGSRHEDLAVRLQNDIYTGVRGAP